LDGALTYPDSISDHTPILRKTTSGDYLLSMLGEESWLEGNGAPQVETPPSLCSDNPQRLTRGHTNFSRRGGFSVTALTVEGQRSRTQAGVFRRRKAGEGLP